jgi:hypothetical protein
MANPVVTKVQAFVAKPTTQAAIHSAWRFALGAAIGLVTNEVVNNHELTIPALIVGIQQHWQGYLLAQVVVPAIASWQARNSSAP